MPLQAEEHTQSIKLKRGLNQKEIKKLARGAFGDSIATARVFEEAKKFDHHMIDSSTIIPSMWCTAPAMSSADLSWHPSSTFNKKLSRFSPNPQEEFFFWRIFR